MPESILEPSLPICDPHHHLYLDGSPVFPAYSIDAFNADIDTGHRIVQTVYVETGSAYRSSGPLELQPVGETEWVATLGRPISAIVGFADLGLGAAVRNVLDAHVEAGRGRFRGTRFRTPVAGQPRAPVDFLSDSAFRRGAAVLRELELTLDVWAFSSLLPSVEAFARSEPDLTIVVNHLGAPVRVQEGTRADILARWRSAIRDLARCDNVVMKLGGIGMPVMTSASELSLVTSEALAHLWGPEIVYAIEQFGHERCMFESNYPIDGQLVEYPTLWNTFKRVAAAASDSEKASLFHDTAARVYRLGDG